jgi:hypothetical protein
MDLGSQPPLIEFHTVTETAGIELIQQVREVPPWEGPGHNKYERTPRR